MAEKIRKIPSKSNSRRNDILENQEKLRCILKNSSHGSKIKSELPAYSHASKNTSLDAASKTYYGKCYEDHQVRLKLLELTPRNPAKQTSEGVQEFIKQVSNFIEKKNPFKESVMNSFGGLERNAGSASLHSVPFNLNEDLKEDQSFTFVAKNLKKSTEVMGEDGSSFLGDINRKTQNSTISTKKTPERNSPGRKNEMGGFARKRDSNDKRRQKEQEAGNKKNAEQKRVITLSENPIFYYENERRSFSLNRNEKKSSEGSNKQIQGKKKRPSEIPLRKNRKDGTQNPKAVSMLMQKPLKDVDSSLSVDLYSKKKPFSPIEELSLCSEIQITINAIDSSEDVAHLGKSSDSELIKRKTSEDSLRITKLNRCCESPNIPVENNLSCILLSDNLSSSTKKPKVLDIDRLKTSSFTVIQSNSAVLNRLEFLHKQNVSSKEKIVRNFSKPKVTVSKSSFDSLKEQNSRKSLLFRQSSKGFKSNLKIKGKKNKKEIDGSFLLPKNCSRTKKKTHLDLCKEVIAQGKLISLISEICNVEKRKGNINQTASRTNLGAEKTKKQKESHLPIRLSKLEDKSVPTEIATYIEKELEVSPNITPAVSNIEFKDSPEFENPKSAISFTFDKNKEKWALKNEFDEEKSKSNFGSKSDKSMPQAPPSTPIVSSDITETSYSDSEPERDDESSSKTVILDDAFSQEGDLCCLSEAESRKKPSKMRSKPEKAKRKSKERVQSGKTLNLVIRGAPLNPGKDEPPEKPESADAKKVKVQLKIDLNSQKKVTPEDTKSTESFDWLFMSSIQCDGELAHQNGDANDLESDCIKEKKSNNNISNNSNSDNNNNNINNNNDDDDDDDDYDNNKSVEIKIENEKGKSKSYEPVICKPRKCSSLKSRVKYKTPNVNVKGVRKKMRSDAGDRRLPSSSSFFNSDLSLQKNNRSPRQNLKIGLNGEDQRDLFEDAAAVRLRRRNSEPHSFKEFVWKCTDFPMPKGFKPSVSSMASSLRHLNTDDIDDFIFWEPVPQKMTSCWEASLYHFKKPWTVLSCSVFKDNRQSNTPGLILQNLRNGGNFNIRQYAVNQNERVNCHKEDPFDVEPSIAQKNIDIRNWLAALNFPTPPATSNEPLSEGVFSMQPTIDSQNLKNNEINPKRRKVLPNIKFSDEVPENKSESDERYRASTKWDASEAGGLMELIRRKSGGFVTKEQFLNSEHSVHCPNVTVSFCMYSKPPDERCTWRVKNDPKVAPEQKIIKTLEVSPQPGVSISATVVNSSSNTDESVETDMVREEPLDSVRGKRRLCWGRWTRREINPSELNIWKYLFLLTIFIVTVHYCFLNNSLS